MYTSSIRFGNYFIFIFSTHFCIVRIVLVFKVYTMRIYILYTCISVVVLLRLLRFAPLITRASYIFRRWNHVLYHVVNLYNTIKPVRDGFLKEKKYEILFNKTKVLKVSHDDYRIPQIFLRLSIICWSPMF